MGKEQEVSALLFGSLDPSPGNPVLSGSSWPPLHCQTDWKVARQSRRPFFLTALGRSLLMQAHCKCGIYSPELLVYGSKWVWRPMGAARQDRQMAPPGPGLTSRFTPQTSTCPCPPLTQTLTLDVSLPARISWSNCRLPLTT